MPEFGQLGRDYWLGASEAQLHRTVLFDALPSHALGILSHVLEQRGKIAEAADRLLQAIELQPEEPEYYARLVHLLERRSHRAAKDAFHRALTLSRSSPHCMAILKEFLAKGRDNL